MAATRYTAHGKFLITGEYAILDNVPSLALPLKLNQYLEITPRKDRVISWKSYDSDGSLWFTKEFSVDLLTQQENDIEDAVFKKLVEILKTALGLNPASITLLSNGCDAVTTLDFNRKYGMGTSSTLISLIAQWLECDSYQLQFECFDGSGYDIACATSDSPIIYTYNNASPVVEQVLFNPVIKDQLFFVYLNRKQNSRDSIARFDKSKLTDAYREELTAMPSQLIGASDSLSVFNTLIDRHEQLISSLIGLQPVKQRLFDDFKGSVKSLGGWGGDFIMATGDKKARDYFIAKGYDVILEWDDVVAVFTPTSYT